MSRIDALQLTPVEFQEFRAFLKSVAGIDLGDNKQYLVSTRLRRVLVEYECTTLTQLTKLIKTPGNKQEKQKVIDVMTTNETFWFRDSYPFDYLKSTILPELSKERSGGKHRIWSAACSSGQEPFSLSMMIEECMKENFATKNLNVEITATDLSSVILDKAKLGEYDRLSISRGMPQNRLKTFFDQVDLDLWRAKQVIRNRISFRSLNLQDSFVAMGKFDVIFCRNVLIYFSAELKRDILTRMHAALVPGGALFLGSSESLSGASGLFDMVHCNPGVMYRAKI